MEDKLYGIYPAICKDVKDPEKRSRIRVESQQAFGSKELSNWAEACLPVTSNAQHNNHVPHTAADIAALLKTSASSASDPQGGSITIPELNIVAKTSGVLLHPHEPSPPNGIPDIQDEDFDPSFSDGYHEHNYHRKIPRINQVVWIMFIGGNPDLPVWIGVGK